MGDMKGNKDGFLYLMTEQRVINQLIIQEILNQEAKARGIKVSNKDVDQAIKKSWTNGWKRSIDASFETNDVSVGEFKTDVKNQVKMQN